MLGISYLYYWTDESTEKIRGNYRLIIRVIILEIQYFGINHHQVESKSRKGTQT